MACSSLSLSLTLKYSKNKNKIKNKLTDALNEVFYYCTYLDRINQLTKKRVGGEEKGGNSVQCQQQKQKTKDCWKFPDNQKSEKPRQPWVSHGGWVGDVKELKLALILTDAPNRS